MKARISPSMAMAIASIVLLLAVFGCGSKSTSSSAPRVDDDTSPTDDDTSPVDDDDGSPDDDDNDDTTPPLDDDTSPPDDDDTSPTDDDDDNDNDDDNDDNDNDNDNDNDDNDDNDDDDNDTTPADDDDDNDTTPTDDDDDTVVDPGFVRVDHGTFTMGSPLDEPGRNSDEVQHSVTLTHDFETLIVPIQQGDFISLMGYNPSYFQSCGDHCPVENVTWFDALAYANASSSAGKLTLCYVFANVQCLDGSSQGANYMACMNATQKGIASADVTLNGVTSVYDCTGYRLPTEAEAEYAERAGTTTAFYSGPITYTTECSPVDPNLDPIGWYCGNDNVQPEPVGTRTPNSLGLYDMSSDVWQWCWDQYGAYAAGQVINPEGPATGALQRWTGRGCSFINPAEYCRSAFRFNWSPTEPYNSLGFRLVKSLN
jgi:formylglycine-generating enzyme required for sulfatase activity